MKKNELARKLARFGCYLVEEKANHEWWYSPISKMHFPIPRHGTQEIPSGTLKNIAKQSGIKI